MLKSFALPEVLEHDGALWWLGDRRQDIDWEPEKGGEGCEGGFATLIR